MMSVKDYVHFGGKLKMCGNVLDFEKCKFLQNFHLLLVFYVRQLECENAELSAWFGRIRYIYQRRFQTGVQKTFCIEKFTARFLCRKKG